MRVQLAPDQAISSQWPLFVLVAETDADIILLRLFERKSSEQGGIQIANYGGNASEGKWSLAISPKYVPAINARKEAQ